jgi:hypothetical protein
VIRIEVRPEVERALSAAFPVPKNAARRAMRKYVQVLEQLLTQAIMNGRTPAQVKLNTYSISLQRLANLGGQIGPNRQRVHAWLRDKGLELVRTVTQGSNLTGVVSTVKVTELANLVPETGYPTNKEMAITINPGSDYAVDEVNTAPSQDVDWLEVDIKSLKAYTQWVTEQSNLISKEVKQRVLLQANTVLAEANSSGAKYPQIRKPSVFGRMYYEGLSIQNVNKELRRAILGDCWEYDIRSSVISWKMGFAEECLAALGSQQSIRKAFEATISYLEDRKDFMRTVRHFIFLEGSNVAPDLQRKLLKQAVTAISFGARASTTGWFNMAGQWTNPALVEILKNTEERQRFLGDPTIRKFIQEQNQLDDFIFDLFKSEASDFLKQPYLQTPSGRVSKSKVLAFCYQHSETQVMDIVRDMASKHGRIPLASIHDAVFFRQRLGAELKSEIEAEVRDKTANTYWSLGAKQLQGYSCVSKDILEYEAQHKRRIQLEEAMAAGYASPWS